MQDPKHNPSEPTKTTRGSRRQSWNPGEWRITDDGAATEEYYENINPSTGAITAGWRPTCELGGRIVYYDESVVQIELKWNLESMQRTITFTAPIRILGYRPQNWRREGANIPDMVLTNPDWPIRGNNGWKWLSAMKAAS